MARHRALLGLLAAVLTFAWVVVPPESSWGSTGAVLLPGATGSSVREAQRLLNSYAVPICGRQAACLADYRLVEDGRFGPNTLDTVRMFQAQQDLTIDGIIGPRTWAELRNRTDSCVVARRALAKYGAKPSDLDIAVGIAYRESGCRLQAVNRNSRTRDNSHGPWQINYYGKLIAREKTIAPISANHASWRSAIAIVLRFARTTGWCHWRTARC